jgi:hypothetical protein
VPSRLIHGWRKRAEKYHLAGSRYWGLVVATILVVAGLPLSLGVPTSAAGSSTTSNQGCSSAIALADKNIVVPTGQGIETARASPQFSNISSGFVSVWFATTNDQWSFTPSCEVTFEGVNVVFGLNTTAGLAKWLVVDETANLSKVVQVYTALVGRLQTYSRWSGYELWGNQNHNTYVLESQIKFSQPKPIYPSQCDNTIGQCYCSYSGTCVIGVWAGLSDTLGASSGNLAQDGTLGEITCGSNNCVLSYEGFYELLTPTTNAVPCNPSGGISAGNGITATTTDEAVNGNYNNLYYYDFVVSDTSTGQACTKTGLYYVMSPSYSEQIWEWPEICNPGGTSCVTLAEFQNGAPSGSTWYNGQLVPDYTVYSKGYYLQDTLTEWCSTWGQSIDVTTGSMSSGSQWAEVYITSACT